MLGINQSDPVAALRIDRKGGDKAVDREKEKESFSIDRQSMADAIGRRIKFSSLRLFFSASKHQSPYRLHQLPGRGDVGLELGRGGGGVDLADGGRRGGGVDCRHEFFFACLVLVSCSLARSLCSINERGFEMCKLLLLVVLLEKAALWRLSREEKTSKGRKRARERKSEEEEEKINNAKGKSSLSSFFRTKSKEERKHIPPPPPSPLLEK